MDTKTNMESPKLSKGKARGKVVSTHLRSSEYAEIVTAIKKAQAAKFNSQNFSKSSGAQTSNRILPSQEPD
jgi:hypothetical protein